jgi:hypothetical protein
LVVVLVLIVLVVVALITGAIIVAATPTVTAVPTARGLLLLYWRRSLRVLVRVVVSRVRR